MENKLELSNEELDNLANKVIELRNNDSGIQIEYKGELLQITKNNKIKILSDQEIIALKIYLDMLDLSLDQLKGK